MQPLLADVERVIVAETEAARAKPTEAERTAAVSEVRKHVRTALRPLVGPDADTEEPLLRTHAAYRSATYHLILLLK